jgi:His-Xaa-Ser system protein HxsD
MGSRQDGEGQGEMSLVAGVIRIVLDLRVYRLAAIKKAAYRFADRFTAMLESPEGERLALALQFKASVTEVVAREAVRQFYQELLDQELREQIAEETNAVRTLILAHAFSNADLIRHDK